VRQKGEKGLAGRQKMSASQSVFVFLFYQSSVYGINATWRARLIAAVSAR
jgi:hypothetical protein